MVVHIRNFRETDIAGIVAAASAAMRADRETLIMTETELRGRLVDPRLDPARDVWVAENQQGIVGFGYGLLRCDTKYANYLTRGYVHPDCRRQGIGTKILNQQWERLAEISQSKPELVTLMAARVQETQVGALALLHSAQFRPGRYFYEMENRLEGAPQKGQNPAGMNLLRWSELRQDRDVWTAVNEAFADHWGFVADSFESFEHRIQSGILNPQYSIVAVDGVEIVGGALCQMGPFARERFQKNLGYLGMLFVRRPWRRQGLGETLLRSAIQTARDAGHSSLRLTVDTENPTGALRLYEKTGFHPVIMTILFQKRYEG